MVHQVRRAQIPFEAVFDAECIGAIWVRNAINCEEAWRQWSHRQLNCLTESTKLRLTQATKASHYTYPILFHSILWPVKEVLFCTSDTSPATSSCVVGVVAGSHIPRGYPAPLLSLALVGGYENLLTNLSQTIAKHHLNFHIYFFWWKAVFLLTNLS